MAVPCLVAWCGVVCCLQGKSARNRDTMVGPTHTLRTVHQGDGRELEVEVQLVRRNPPARTYWVVVRPATLCMGRLDLREWLCDMAWHTKVESALGTLKHKLGSKDKDGNRSLKSTRSIGSLTRRMSGKSGGSGKGISFMEGPLSPQLGLGTSSKEDGGEEEEEEGEDNLVLSGLARKVRQASFSGGPKAPTTPRSQKEAVHKAAPHDKDVSGSQLMSVDLDQGIKALVGGSPKMALNSMKGPAFGSDGDTALAAALLGGHPSPSLAPPPVVPAAQPVAAAPEVAGVLAPLEEDVLVSFANAQAQGGHAVDPLDRIAHWVLTDGAEYGMAAAPVAGAGQALQAMQGTPAAAAAAAAATSPSKGQVASKRRSHAGMSMDGEEGDGE